MDTEYLAARLQCSRTDKQECLGIVRQLLELAFFAREHGLVELDNYLYRNSSRFPDPFLRKAFSCLVDIGDRQMIEKVLTNYILSGNFTGHQFLKNMVIMETVLAMHSRAGLDQIFSFLVPSLFGMDSEQEVLDLYQQYTKDRGFSLSLDGPGAPAGPAQAPPPEESGGSPAGGGTAAPIG